MGLNQISLFRRSIIVNSKNLIQLTSVRTFAAGGKSKKGSKGGAAANAPKASILSKEVTSTTVIGAKILKEVADSKVMADSKYYSVWLWHLLDKHPPLSKHIAEEECRNPFLTDLKRFGKLDSRERIKENSFIKAKS
ncbi:54S ribosomal protein L37 [Cucumis melo var. makuwa]|uniref:Large ribosomal subunit protein mL54 n=1 Tax=Cucumis melo var. makuwa TaxID=1194695 RepID=A0A5D3DQ60_CUCMM|nr:54S ribosomal protein L37 [Cucumis melo var. makuwa]